MSVVIAAHDAAPFLGAAIESVLGQSLGDLELLVVDDGSLDGAGDVARQFRDRRLTFLVQERQGLGQAIGQALARAQGRYVALLGAEDVACPRRLERQLEQTAAGGSPAVFSWVEAIDEHGTPLAAGHPVHLRFNRPGSARAATLAELFFEGNRFCASTALVERQALLDAGPFPVVGSQLRELAVWLRLLLHHDLQVVQEPLVRYRLPSDGSRNETPTKAARAHFELLQWARVLLRDVPPELFREAFATRLVDPRAAEGVALELEKAFLCLRHPAPMIRLLGVERLHGLLADPRTLALARSRHGFGLPELHLLTDTTDVCSSAEYLANREWADWLDAQRQSLEAGWLTLRAEVARLESLLAASNAEGVALRGEVAELRARLGL